MPRRPLDQRTAKHRLNELVRHARALERDAHREGACSRAEGELRDFWADRRGEFLALAEDVLNVEGGG
jgi:hypothetical protein